MNKNQTVWLALALFMCSVASVIKFQGDSEKWRYQASLVATALFLVLLVAALYGALKRRKN
jgi:hypothetical protein